eukprot:87630-Pelagomonas_calceolata.AAC.1
MLQERLPPIQPVSPRHGTGFGSKERKGIGCIAVPAYEGSLAEALKEMPATKPDSSLKLKRKAPTEQGFIGSIDSNFGSCSNYFSNNHATFVNSSMLARIAMKYRVQQPED